MKKYSLLFLLFFPLVHCGGSSTPAPTPTAATYSIGGAVSGLSGTVILQNNAGDDLTLTADGDFTFATKLADAADYAVTVSTQPTDETCSISNSTGTLATADVTNISIVCSSATYTVGGTLTGLSGTVVLQNNTGDDLTLTADGEFTFATAVADAAGYIVTVATNPSGQTCGASTNSGTMSGANVTNVVVTCSSNTYTLGGTVTGLAGTLILQNNGTDNLSRTTNGSFTFTTAVADGSAYAVTAPTVPAGQTCTVTNGGGTMSGSNVTNVTVACTSANKIVFVTSTAYANGNLGGLSGADDECNTLASAAGLLGTFSAWLSTSTVNAKDRVSIGHAGGFVLVNGTVIATSFSDLLDGSIQNTLNRDENGTTRNVNTLTGTSADGTAHANNCNDWTSASAGLSGWWGADTVTNGQWTDFASNICSIGNPHLYCFQD